MSTTFLTLEIFLGPLAVELQFIKTCLQLLCHKTVSEIITLILRLGTECQSLHLSASDKK